MCRFMEGALSAHEAACCLTKQILLLFEVQVDVAIGYSISVLAHAVVPDVGWCANFNFRNIVSTLSILHLLQVIAESF